MRRKIQPTQGNLAQQLFNAPQADDLYSVAREYVARGWSVIPLNQDKTAAVGWSQFQKQIANDLTLATWFAPGRFSALGVVCGRVSRLGVLDFDELAKAALFRQQLPHLADTREIRTGFRRAPHFYYTLSDDLLGTKTTHVKEIADFQANGAYVVAWPSVIDGGMWELVNDVPVYTLTKHDYAAILDFLGVGKSPTPAPVIVLPKPITADGLADVYWHERETKGRNESAYKAALAGRKTMSLEDAIAGLAVVFIGDPAPDGHKPQSERARYNELAATVASAYGAEYDVSTGQYQERSEGLPNSAREWLMRNKGVHHARILDLLYMTGLQPGQRFTERGLIDCGKEHGIGNKTVRNFLLWLESEITVLRTDASQSANQLVSELPIYTWLPTNTMYCMWQFGHQLKRGVKSKVYALPDPIDICTAIGVEVSPGDKLEISDLRSAAAYRAGMTRALVARRENKPMSRKWQAERLGVSVRTAYSYDKDAGIEAIPNSEVTPIGWHNLDRVPLRSEDGRGYGYYLQIDGVKTVPRRYTAMDALNAGKKVEYVERRANKYRLKRD